MLSWSVGTCHSSFKTVGCPQVVEPDQTIGWVREGDTIYYRDNKEQLKVRPLPELHKAEKARSRAGCVVAN